jgi:hypothetical protein
LLCVTASAASSGFISVMRSGPNNDPPLTTRNNVQLSNRRRRREA